MGNLLYFYGDECDVCEKIKPLLNKLEKELKVKIQKFEVWHNDANARKFREYDQGRCGGLPFLINTKTNEIVCGYKDYEGLKEWASA